MKRLPLNCRWQRLAGTVILLNPEWLSRDGVHSVSNSNIPSYIVGTKIF
jgi:hypothetical protein